MNPFNYNTETVPRRGGLLLDALQTIVVALAISVVVYLFLAIPNQVDGLSMYPNLQDKEILLTNKLIQILGGPNNALPSYNYQRGDIVVFQQPDRPDLVKRVIGLPGEKIKVENGRININGKVLIEEYLAAGLVTDPGSFLSEGLEKTVPPDSYAVFGDNRPNSKDSRSAEVGFVKREYLKGASFIRLFPLNKFGLLERGKYQEVSAQ